MMIIDTPLPMPNRSICSPSHIRKIVPAVNALIPITHHTGLVYALTYRKFCFSRKTSHPNPWNRHRMIVRYRVHSMIF